MSDELKECLYGKTIKVKLADDKEYILREPDLDTLESLNFDTNNINDIKTIKSVTLALLKLDNPSINEKSISRLITFSMVTEGSELMNGIQYVLGRDKEPKKA